MKQYNAIKVKYPDALLLFRVGDFYETFGEDAKKASGVLDIVLTKRGAGSETETALAGFPHHSLNTYLPKLVKAGFRVAICDQLEDPKMTKTIVKRGVTELVTPGVSLNDEVLQTKSNNFLAAVHFGKKYLGVSFLDISTGEFLTAQGNADYIDKLLQNFKPSEILVQKQNKVKFSDLFGAKNYCFYLEDWVFQTDFANEILLKHFKIASLKSFGVDELTEGIIAAGSIMHYLTETQHNRLDHITSLKRIEEEIYVGMDKFTIRNLELYSGTSSGSVTLLSVIDKTASPMGGRLLKRWLALPLKDESLIKSRHDVVKYIIDHPKFYDLISTQIKAISDIERLISKVATLKISPREIANLKTSLEAIIPIKEAIAKSGAQALTGLNPYFKDCSTLIAKINTNLHPDAPVSLQKGHAIADGVSEELDELRGLAKSGKSYLDKMLAREIERTQITSLKISFNKALSSFGQNSKSPAPRGNPLL